MAVIVVNLVGSGAGCDRSLQGGASNHVKTKTNVERIYVLHMRLLYLFVSVFAVEYYIYG